MAETPIELVQRFIADWHRTQGDETPLMVSALAYE